MRLTRRSPLRRLHAVCVTGRLLLGDLVNRAVAACSTPSTRSRQGACALLKALSIRTHPALMAGHAPDVMRAALYVLRCSGTTPDQAALTVVSALHCLRECVE